MPIQVPGYGSSEGGGKQPRMSDAGVKPWLALAELGQKGLRAAKALDDHNKRIQQIEDEADLAEFKNKAQTLYANRKLSFFEDHDYSSYKENWEGDLGTLSTALNESGMTEDARRKASLWLENFSTGTRIGVAEMVQKKSVERAKQAFANQMQFLQENFDVNYPEGGRALAYDTIQNASFLSPEEQEGALIQFEKFASNQVESSTIMEDPGKWLENNSEPSGNLTDWKRKTNLAKAALAERQTSQADDVLNFLYSGNNISPEDIEEMTPDLDAKARQKLADAIDDYNSRGTKNRILTDPDFYNQIVGEITTGIDSYEPGINPMVDGYIDLRNKIDALPTGAVKTYLSKKILDKRNQKEKERKDTRDWAFGLIDELYKEGQFGALTVSDVREDSLEFHIRKSKLLRDPALIQDLGFPEDISKLISDKWTGSNNQKVDKTGAINLLKDNWFLTNAKSKDFPKDKFELFEAINRSSSLTEKFAYQTQYEEREKQITELEKIATKNRGSAFKEVSDLFELTPNATREDVVKRLGEKFEKISIDAKAKAIQEKEIWMNKFEEKESIPDDDAGVSPPLEEK